MKRIDAHSAAAKGDRKIPVIDHAEYSTFEGHLMSGDLNRTGAYALQARRQVRGQAGPLGSPIVAETIIGILWRDSREGVELPR